MFNIPVRTQRSHYAGETLVREHAGGQQGQRGEMRPTCEVPGGVPGGQPGHMSRGVARGGAGERRLEHAASDLRKETRKYNFSGLSMLRSLAGG